MTAIKRWAHVEVWVEYGPETDGSDIDRLFDAVAEAAHRFEPPGLDVHVSGAANQPAPLWALDDPPECDCYSVCEHRENCSLRSGSDSPTQESA